MTTTSTILTTLKDRGERLTRARRALVEFLAKTSEPVSAEDLLVALKKQKIAVNKTTVYRELEFLLTAGLIRPIFLNQSRKHYELSLGIDHHHHVVCRDCGRVEEVELQGVEKLLAPLEKRLAKKIGFKEIHHTLEFFGWCGKCAHK